MKTVVNENGISMNDKERMDIIDRCYNYMLQNRSRVLYFTNKNIGGSYLRAMKRNDLDRVMALYGSPNERTLLVILIPNAYGIVGCIF